MPQDDDRRSAMLASRDERIQSYLKQTRSTDDIVREVTTAFAQDVARIMAGAEDRVPRSERARPETSRRERRR